MAEQTQTLIKDSSLPYKEKLVAGGYEELSHLPPSRDDSDWGLLLNSVLSPPELIKLKNALFPNVEGKRKRKQINIISSYVHIHLVGCPFPVYYHLVFFTCCLTCVDFFLFSLRHPASSCSHW